MLKAELYLESHSRGRSVEGLGVLCTLSRPQSPHSPQRPAWSGPLPSLTSTPHQLSRLLTQGLCMAPGGSSHWASPTLLTLPNSITSSTAHCPKPPGTMESLGTRGE